MVTLYHFVSEKIMKDVLQTRIQYANLFVDRLSRNKKSKPILTSTMYIKSILDKFIINYISFAVLLVESSACSSVLLFKAANLRRFH